MQSLRALAATSLLALGAAPVRAQFVAVGPRGDEAPATYLIRADNLVDARRRLRAGDRRLQPAYEALIRDARAAMRVGPFSVMDKGRVGPSGDKHDYVSSGPYWWPDSTKPDGLPYVQRDGVVNPDSRRDSDSPRFAQMVDAVETLALAAWLADDEDYARRATRLLRTWFLDAKTRMNPHLRYGQGIPGIVDGRGIGLIDTRDLARVVDAVGLLETHRAWTDADQRGMLAWSRAYLTWMDTSANGRDEREAKNNHGTWYDAQAAALALFVGDTALARRTIAQQTTARLAAQIAPSGELPLESARTRPLHYTLFTLEPFERLAEYGRHVGVDLWRWEAPNGASMHRAASYVARWADSTVAPPKPDVTPVSRSEFVEPLRRAAAFYGDAALAAALDKLPAAVAATDRSRLYFPDAP